MLSYICLVLCIICLLYFLLNPKVQDFFTNQHNIIIIIPIRDREKHLNEFLENMIPMLNDESINYKIFIIEQSAKKKFNKGKINNIGFLESTKKYSMIENIFFHDVDNYPLKKNLINYNYSKPQVKHFFGFDGSLGGIYYIPKKIFMTINGFSNQYFGWGLEDIDILTRIKKYNVKLDRNNFIQRYKNNNLISDDETKDKVLSKNNPNIWNINKKLYEENINNIQKDGLKDCKYKIISSKMIKKNVYRILVDI